MSYFSRFVAELKKSPFKTIGYCMSLLRGGIQKYIWLVTNKKITVGNRLVLSGRVVIKGPGSVIIGNNVSLNGTLNSVCTLFTYSENAKIYIGNNSMLNGSRFGCRNKIAIGDNCIIGDARISDNDGHSIKKNRLDVSASELSSKPVALADNVWIGAGVYILKGVKIGNNSVVGSGSVVLGNIPADVFAIGNPARVMGALPE